MGSNKSEPSPVASPAQQAADINAAQAQYDPQAAQRQFQILTDPNYGIKPFTQYQEGVRQDVFPQEQAVRSQLAQNILANLQSPTGISPDQQTAIDARRGKAQTDLVTALRDRANLGGNLYGGRSALQEGQAVGDLQNQFAEEDISRQERSRLNAIQGAIPFLQLLFPDVNLTAPQFQSPVQSPDTYSSSLVSQRGQDIQAQSSADASKSALYGALFQGLGTAAGGFMTGSALAKAKPPVAA
jgi:hypothetical protein